MNVSAAQRASTSMKMFADEFVGLLKLSANRK
jgi:hypothetical protein